MQCNRPVDENPDTGLREQPAAVHPGAANARVCTGAVAGVIGLIFST